MANTFLVRKIQLNSFTDGTVDWIYGNDNTSLQGSTCVDLSALSADDRTNTELVGTFLQQELGSAFFTEKDLELENFQASPPAN
jgi:hypothetical protein